eukprot:9559129-Lingulodinium_polyedra.AAC.1
MPAPVSTTVDVEYEQRRFQLWSNIPLRARLNAEAYLDRRGQCLLRTTGHSVASEVSGDEASEASASASSSLPGPHRTEAEREADEQ